MFKKLSLPQQNLPKILICASEEPCLCSASKESLLSTREKLTFFDTIINYYNYNQLTIISGKPVNFTSLRNSVRTESHFPMASPATESAGSLREALLLLAISYFFFFSLILKESKHTSYSHSCSSLGRDANGISKHRRGENR